MHYSSNIFLYKWENTPPLNSQNTKEQVKKNHMKGGMEHVQINVSLERKNIVFS